MRGPDENNNKKHERKKEEEDSVDEKREGVGQGELYSPQYAVNIPHNQHKPAASPSSVERRMEMVKDRFLVKLGAATGRRQNGHQLERTNSFRETVMRDMTLAAQKEAMQRIKSHLADVFSSLSPSLTSKMVDDAEKEAEDEDESEQQPTSKL